ncbi:MAG: PIG-L family deacetylase [Phycisphaerales bacterium]|nr:PIG-L family deacetylase [Phycisphaerales bacterium]
MSSDTVALSICAHPDDTELLCAGTLALLYKKGWEIHSATMTAGDMGSAEHTQEEISSIRPVEAARSAAVLNGKYHCLHCLDIFLSYDRPTLTKTVELLRKVRPRVVFAPSPQDYMIDHETASRVVQMAAFAAGIPLLETPGYSPINYVPHVYYSDSIDGRDIFGDSIEPRILVDISDVIGIKEQMLCCHETQRDWLLKHHGIDEYVMTMKKMSAERGGRIGRPFAEGFRQHLGHPYPQNNILKTVLGDLVYERK